MIREEVTGNTETGISVGGRIITPSDMQMTMQWWLTVRKGYN